MCWKYQFGRGTNHNNSKEIMLITPDHFSPHRFGNSRVKWSLGLFDTKYGEERRIQMIPTKRCLVLSIRIQLQISTFLAITDELKSRKGSVWLHSLDWRWWKYVINCAGNPLKFLVRNLWELRSENWELLSFDIQRREKTWEIIRIIKREGQGRLG